MHPYKVKFIESSFETTIKHAEQYGKIDGQTSALNHEAYIAEELLQGYDLFSITPVIGNVTGPIGYCNNVTIGYQVCLSKVKDL